MTISDSLECIENLSINLNEPPTYINTSVLEFSDYNGYHISCFGANDGIIYAISNDGVPPYTYEWNNGNLNDTLSDAYSGYYEVVSYDANKCLAIDSITLIEPSDFDQKTKRKLLEAVLLVHVTLVTLSRLAGFQRDSLKEKY